MRISEDFFLNVKADENTLFFKKTLKTYVYKELLFNLTLFYIVFELVVRFFKRLNMVTYATKLLNIWGEGRIVRICF